MVETFYLHLDFTGKNGGWSINLPFLCNKCGICCTLDDFLTAGEINAKPKEHPEVFTKMKTISEELGKMWEADEEKYDQYIQRNPCPYLVDNSCSIYEIRPEGCRRFPNTKFGMLTQNCEPLNRFKKQRTALKKERAAKETYHSAEANIKPVKCAEKQFQACLTKLRQAGITDDELALFNTFNGR